LPLGWKLDVRSIQRGDIEAPEQLESPHDIRAKNLDRSRDAGPAARSEAIRVRAADEHGARPEAQRFDDVAAAPAAAVQQDIGPAADSGDDFRQRPQRCRDAVELPSAVV